MIYLKDSKIKVTSAKEVAKVFQDILAVEDTIEQDKEHYYVMHLHYRTENLFDGIADLFVKQMSEKASQLAAFHWKL